MADEDQVNSGAPMPEGDFFERMPKELEALANWQGNLVEFWKRYAGLIGRISHASVVMVAVKSTTGDGNWKRLSQWEASDANNQHKALFRGQVPGAADYCTKEGVVCRPLSADADAPGATEFTLAISLPLKASRDTFVVVSLLEGSNESKARDTLLRQLLVAELPNQLLLRQSASRARDDVQKIASVLDLVAQVSPEQAFLSSAIAFCNAMAGKHQCERVSLGWVEGDGIRLQAMSHTERFDRKMEAIQLLEAAMEEALDQNEIIVFPAEQDGGPLTRDHAQYQKSEDLKHICSIPLHKGDDVVGVITLERMAGTFAETEVQQIQLPCDLLSYRLQDLKYKDRWFGARMKDGIRDFGAKFFGPEHTLSKLIGILILLGLLAMILIRVPYRVEANFILKSDEVFYQSVPFDSYIEEVFKEAGDPVNQGDALLKLDTDDLELEQSSIIADLNRFKREAEKARAARQLADMRISEALVEQNQARLELVQWRISQATLKSPIDGIMVEGDLKERLGAPVREGEVLFRIARIDRLYVEAEANERDIDDVLGAVDGEIAFVSQPKEKFPISIDRVEPSAVTKTSENVFLIRTAFLENPESWFRPGMSGVAKLNAGKRSLFYIFTHRTVDFLRMFFWW